MRLASRNSLFQIGNMIISHVGTFSKDSFKIRQFLLRGGSTFGPVKNVKEVSHVKHIRFDLMKVDQIESRDHLFRREIRVDQK